MYETTYAPCICKFCSGIVGSGDYPAIPAHISCVERHLAPSAGKSVPTAKLPAEQRDCTRCGLSLAESPRKMYSDSRWGVKVERLKSWCIACCNAYQVEKTALKKRGTWDRKKQRTWKNQFKHQELKRQHG